MSAINDRNITCETARGHVCEAMEMLPSVARNAEVDKVLAQTKNLLAHAESRLAWLRYVCETPTLDESDRLHCERLLGIDAI